MTLAPPLLTLLRLCSCRGDVVRDATRMRSSIELANHGKRIRSERRALEDQI
jgi:hypothetical protein